MLFNYAKVIEDPVKKRNIFKNFHYIKLIPTQTEYL